MYESEVSLRDKTDFQGLDRSFPVKKSSEQRQLLEHPVQKQLLSVIITFYVYVCASFHALLSGLGVQTMTPIVAMTLYPAK